MRIAINGFGRIGRNILRACFERNLQQQVQIVAINDLNPPETLAHLLQYDSVHGRFSHQVQAEKNGLSIDGRFIQTYQHRDPANIAWQQHDIDIVMECTGHFTSREQAYRHIQAGAQRVLISAPAKDSVDATVVYGVNHHQLSPTATIVSNASCTTNCLAPMAQILHQNFTIQRGSMLTVHASTNDQVVSDVAHADLRRARSAMINMIPTKTGAAAAIGLVLPELTGKLDGIAIRVPTLNVSLLQLVVELQQPTDLNAIHHAFATAAAGSHRGIIDINNQPLVSCDFNHHSASCIIDISQTKKIDKMFQLLAWYDNEWGFANRMLDTGQCMLQCKKATYAN